MQIWSLSQIPQNEKEDILSKHRELYNGYQMMQPKVENTQPLYVQDFAKDKLGATITNKGEIKPYTDYRINESHVMDTCEQCGGQLAEGECSECGWKMESQLDELSAGDLSQGKKYKFKSPSFDDEIEFDTEVEDKQGGKKMFKFKGKKAHHLMPDKDIEDYVSSEIEEEKYKTGHLDDIYKVNDLGNADFDYVEGGGNKSGTFEKMHHMKKIKSESASSNAPLSYGKHYDEVKEPYDFKSNGPVGDGGTLRQKNIKEQGLTGGGNAPDFDVDYENPAYDFESEGPKEDTFTVPADDMDLDEKKVKKPFDFVSGGADNGGDAYPVFEGEFEDLIDTDNELEDEREELEETEFEEMKSAWEEEMEEEDISGVQGVYGDTEKPYAFVSTGPGKAGPYQTNSWGGEKFTEQYSGEDEDVHWEKDLEDDELDLDLTKFNPEDKSWEEITAHTGEDEFANLDEDIKESLEIQKNKIVEMFSRMKNFS